MRCRTPAQQRTQTRIGCAITSSTVPVLTYDKHRPPHVRLLPACRAFSGSYFGSPHCLSREHSGRACGAALPTLRLARGLTALPEARRRPTVNVWLSVASAAHGGRWPVAGSFQRSANLSGCGGDGVGAPGICPALPRLANARAGCMPTIESPPTHGRTVTWRTQDAAAVAAPLMSHKVAAAFAPRVLSKVPKFTSRRL
jgi:hypothetical protein